MREADFKRFYWIIAWGGTEMSTAAGSIMAHECLNAATVQQAELLDVEMYCSDSKSTEDTARED